MRTLITTYPDTLEAFVTEGNKIRRVIGTRDETKIECYEDIEASTMYLAVAVRDVTIFIARSTDNFDDNNVNDSTTLLECYEELKLWKNAFIYANTEGSVADGNKGDITVSSSGSSWQINNKGSANGIATLDATGKVPSSQLPTGTAISDTDDVPEGSTNLYFTTARVSDKAPLASPTFTGTVSGITKAMVGLGNVDNTSDANKPISTATQTALDLKVDKVAGKGLSTEDYTTVEKSKLAGIASGAEVNVNSDWTAISGDAQILNKPSTFTPSSHTHPQSDINNLVSDLAAKQATITATTSADYYRGDKTMQPLNKTAVGLSNVPNLDTTAAVTNQHTHSNKTLLDTYTQTEANLADAVTKKHTHANQTALDNVSGVNTGDQDLSNLVVKNTSITGAAKTKITYDSKGLVTSGTDATTADIADSTNKRYVTDANLTTLGAISGTNTGDETTSSIQTKRPLKTVNGNSLEGSGNITISGGGTSAWGDITGTLADQTDLQDALDDKQDVLVSGTSIKTINGASVLGSGNLVVTGEGGVSESLAIAYAIAL
jgi:hypothetical protein